MNIFRLLLLTTKQVIKKPAVIVLLLLIPICVLFLNNTSKSEKASITALYYLDADSEDTEALYDALENYDGLFQFEPVDSENKLRRMVNSGEYECGYIIDSEIYEKLADKEYSDLIELVYHSRSTMTAIINETVFSICFPTAAQNAIVEYLTKKGVSKETIDEYYSKQDIKDIYYTYFTNGSTFHFEYEGAPEEFSITKNTIMLTPLRGILALIIMIAGFSGALSLYRDNNNPVYSYKRIRFAFIAVPVLLSGLTAYISIVISKLSEDYIKELLYLMLYMIVVIIYCYILSEIIKNGALFAGLLPFIILGSMAFTPVILDFAQYLPVLSKLRFIWPTWYYLLFFN